MKTAWLVILSMAAFPFAAIPGACFGAEPDPSVLAVGPWSEPVRTANYMKLRGRLKICEYSDNRGIAPKMDVALYVELQEFSDSVGGTEEVYFDPQGLKCGMVDSAGKTVPQAFTAFGGGVPGAVWIRLPSYSSQVLRITPYNGGGRMPDGGFELWASIPQAWKLKADDPTTYYLSGELTIKRPDNHKTDNPRSIWSGKLKLPKMAVSIKQLRAKN